MPHPPINSLRFRLMLLVALTLLPSVALLSYNASERKAQAARQMRLDAHRLIERASGECEQLLDSAQSLLTVISQAPEIRRMDAGASTAMFKSLVPGNPQYLNFGLANAKGQVIASMLPLRGNISIADRGYFSRAVSTRAFSVGEYQIGRIVPRPAVNVAVPVFDMRGKVRGVLYAALDLDFLGRLAVGLNLPEGADFTIVDRSGIVAVRNPDPDKWVGRSVRELPEGRAVLTQGSGVIQVRDRHGVLRQYTFAPLRSEHGGINARVSVGVPVDVVLKDVNYARLRNMVIMQIVAVLTLLAAYLGTDAFVLRRVRRLLKATQRITAGDLAVRTGLGAGGDELALFGRSFDEMAQSLQAARDDLLRAERERQGFYTEVIRCVTQDRFHLVEREAIPLPGSLVREMALANANDFVQLRSTIRQVADEAGMAPANTSALVHATGEAATNALKHGRDGRCAIFKNDKAILTRVCDSGSGIHAQDLAATILLPGFSTKISLGMGYTVMLELADRVWLATGPDGTIVQLEKSLATRPNVDPGIEAAIARMP